MSALLQAELLKLRTTRTFAALVGVALALSLLVVVLSAVLPDVVTRVNVRELFTFNFTASFILVLGVLGMAGEWRHRTITSTVLAAPDRVRLLAAKTLSYAVAGAVLSLVVTLAVMAVGTAILAARDQVTLGAGDLADILWRNLLVAGLLGAVGVCVGGLVRDQGVAIIGVLAFTFVFEPAVLALAPDVGRFGPFSGAPNGIVDLPFDDEALLAPGLAVAVMVAWIGVLFAAAALLLRERDLG